AIGKTGPTGALARPEHRSHQGKNARGLNEQPWSMVRDMPPIQFVHSFFKVVVDQRDGQVGRTLHDANAQLAQGGAAYRRALYVERVEAHPTILQILFSGLQR